MQKKKKKTDVRTAQHAWEKSCYFNIDYKIDEGSTVYDAISRMSAYNVGCLIVTKNGVVSVSSVTYLTFIPSAASPRTERERSTIVHHAVPALVGEGNTKFG